MYLVVTADKYELPLSFGATLNELGVLMGKKPNSLYYLYKLCGVSKHTFNGHHYKIVFVESDNE